MLDFEIYFETMAGTHLEDSVRALRDAGSADALYDPSLRDSDHNAVSYEDASLASDEAQGWRVTYCRRALLFAAFAAEAYANDFLYEKWAGEDRKKLQRLPTVEKYACLPRRAGATTVLDRSREPLRKLEWLFDRRNELVHARPLDDRDLTWDPTNHNPLDAATSIVAVADAASTLFGGAEAGSVLSRALVERERLLAYGVRASKDLPDLHATPSDQDLLRPAKPRSGG
jgi:hypothetical protein